LVSPEDLDQALQVLAEIARDPLALSGVPADRRAELQRLAGEIARPALRARKKLQKALLRKEHQERRDRDQELRSGTGIRQLRAAPVFLTPSPQPRWELGQGGGGEAGTAAAPTAHAHAAADAALAAPAAAPAAADAPADADAAAAADADAASPSPPPPLSSPRKCYVCKAPYHRLHPFYDQLCPSCGDENFARRSPRADLRGRVALVTGARVKIGFQAAILLLRSGCSVVAATRFPHDAAARYGREADFADWADRLSVVGIDLRHAPSVELLCGRLAACLPRLDFQLHNACQTVRRPPGFYAHLLEREERPAAGLPEPERRLLGLHEELRRELAGLPAARGATESARLSQAATEADLALLAPGALPPPSLFPAGSLDQDLQQVDLRAHNSWRLRLHEVPTQELLEVLLVNASAPFTLTAKLKGLMLRAAGAPPGTATSGDPARHVVMVSAMEGQFYRQHKTDKHPHTNMAKAALNMLVRTSAQDLVRDGIHLNAVDTGWVTDEDPAQLAARKVDEHAFSPPLDIVDGAARIVAPIFDGFASGRHAAGLFYKDYLPAPW
jgi:NAD(P)-dependent dehydrogenase (short-subunit alcohol dehydrogenase family)